MCTSTIGNIKEKWKVDLMLAYHQRREKPKNVHLIVTWNKKLKLGGKVVILLYTYSVRLFRLPEIVLSSCSFDPCPSFPSWTEFATGCVSACPCFFVHCVFPVEHVCLLPLLPVFHVHFLPLLLYLTPSSGSQRSVHRGGSLRCWLASCHSWLG